MWFVRIGDDQTGHIWSKIHQWSAVAVCKYEYHGDTADSATTTQECQKCKETQRRTSGRRDVR